MQVRDNARAILVNSKGQVLLEKIEVDVVDPAGKIRSPYWLTPGGGIETGETPAQAVAREIHEECGMDEFVIGPMVWYCEHELVIRGTPILSRDHYFFVTTPHSRIVMDGMEQPEQEKHCEFRWWLASEILASTEIFAPPNLGLLLDSLLVNDTENRRVINIPW